MTKQTLIKFYIIAVIANTLLDYVVKYWGVHTDIGLHLLTSFVLSLVLTTVIFFVIRKALIKK